MRVGRPLAKRPLNWSENLDYLVAAITYLGTHTYYWARTPHHMAREIGLDEDRLARVFDGFPGVFRKSARPSPHSERGQHFYSLQARYALREGKGTEEPEQVSYIKPLAPAQMEQVLEFVLRASQMELEGAKAFRANLIAVTAAVISAATAIAVALLKTGGG